MLLLYCILSFAITDNFRYLHGPEIVRIYIFQMAIAVIEIGLAIITTVIMIPIINKGQTHIDLPSSDSLHSTTFTACTTV